MKQDEIDSLVLTGLESFLEDERDRNDPKAALLACREAAKEQSGKSTPVKQMEEAADRIVERVLEAQRKQATNTTASTGQLQTPNQSEELGGSRPQVGSRPTHNLLSRLDNLEQMMKVGNTTPSISPQISPLHQGYPMQPPILGQWNEFMQQAWAMQQQQQALTMQMLTNKVGKL